MVGRSGSFGGVDPLVVNQACVYDASLVADTSNGDLAFFEQLHEVRTRDGQQVSSLLSGQLGMDRSNSAGIAGGDLNQDIDGLHRLSNSFFIGDVQTLLLQAPHRQDC